MIIFRPQLYPIVGQSGVASLFLNIYRLSFFGLAHVSPLLFLAGQQLNFLTEALSLLPCNLENLIIILILMMCTLSELAPVNNQKP